MPARFRPSPAMIVACVALIVALGGSAYAVTKFVGSDGQIHGCVGKKGNLTLVKPGKHCPKHRSQIVWSKQGAPGAPGAAGADVVARLRGGPVTVPANSSKSVPISPSTFGQGAGDAILLMGSLTVTPPATCGGGMGFFNGVQIQVDGVEIMSVAGLGSPTEPVYLPAAGVPSGGATTHGVSVTANNACTGAGESYTINSLSIDAVRAR